MIDSGTDAGTDARTANAHADTPRPHRAGLRRLLSALVIAGCLFAPLTSDARSEYDPKRAGNPLKIVYYAVYPAAFLVDILIFRPAYYIGQWEPFHTLFGTTRPPEEIEALTAKEEDEDDDS